MCLIVAVCPNTEVVVIHDAVRPIIDEDHLWNITQAAVNHGVRLISSMLKIGMYWSGFLPVLNLTES
jgi:2-C-methyl-D-erythritol 4-phosphate cytidylyltransferase